MVRSIAFGSAVTVAFVVPVLLVASTAPPRYGGVAAIGCGLIGAVVAILSFGFFWERRHQSWADFSRHKFRLSLSSSLSRLFLALTLACFLLFLFSHLMAFLGVFPLALARIVPIGGLVCVMGECIARTGSGRRRAVVTAIVCGILLLPLVYAHLALEEWVLTLFMFGSLVCLVGAGALVGWNTSGHKGLVIAALIGGMLGPVLLYFGNMLMWVSAGAI